MSTPLTWDEIDEKISPQDFTIKTIEARVRAVGDLWAGLRKSKPADLDDGAARNCKSDRKSSHEDTKITKNHKKKNNDLFVPFVPSWRV